MEVPGKDEEVIKEEESHATSAAAFVQGGIQEACDDACSICLDAFLDGNPSTVTNCRHEFHLQCVFEWCQRSSNCPMCWQSISLKDPASQELLEAVEQERKFRLTPPRNTSIYHHPSLGDFDLPHHLSMGINDPDLEDRIMQHLAASAAMGRTHRTARRESLRSRSAAHARPHYVVFSANPNASSNGLETEPGSTMFANSSVPYTSSSSGSSGGPTASQGISDDYRSFLGQSSLQDQDNEGPSEFQTFSDNLKSRLSTISMKYKDSISKSTRGWKEKLFSRSTSMADIGSEVRREVNAGIATVSRMMERLEARDNDRPDHVSQSSEANSSSFTHQSNHDNRDGAPNETPSNGNSSTNSVSS